MSDAASSRGGEVFDVLILNFVPGVVCRGKFSQSPDGAQVTVQSGDPCTDRAILDFSLDKGCRHKRQAIAEIAISSTRQCRWSFLTKQFVP